jgi:hypothetical protein
MSSRLTTSGHRSFAFSASLSVIVLVTQVFMMTGLKAPPTAWDSSLGVFFCFLPMAFLYEAFSHKKTREHIRMLEARIQRLEGTKPLPLELGD